MMPLVKLKQIGYLSLVSLIAVPVSLWWSNVIVSTGWIFPAGFGHRWLLTGILSEIVIFLGPAVFLIVAAWLPGQLKGGTHVSFVLIAGLFLYTALVVVRGSIHFLAMEPSIDPLYIGYSLRELVLGVLIPFALIEATRRWNERRMSRTK